MNESTVHLRFEEIEDGQIGDRMKDEIMDILLEKLEGEIGEPDGQRLQKRKLLMKRESDQDFPHNLRAQNDRVRQLFLQEIQTGHRSDG